MNPYIIGPYKETDSSKFWGRIEEIEGMYKSFMQNDYLVCYADSGEGKSSILNAGLFPKLRENGYYPINIRFRFDDGVTNLDFDSIINTIINNSIHNDDGVSYKHCSLIPDTDERINTSLPTNLIENYVWLRLRYSKLIVKDANGDEFKYTPVLVFDQFEEVFTNPKTEIWTKEFFQWLEEFSTDVCPERILKEIIRCTEDDFPLVSSAKKFKAIFSMRSEYVGNVDYWGLQHFYIPDLKNNRYFLKPLKPQGARAVVTQPQGFPDIMERDLESLIVGCSGNEEYVKVGMPCVPAHILSIICHELYELQESERKILLTKLNNDRNNTVESVLENYYIRTLESCGIKDEKTRDIFENTLVDDKGNRKRISTRHKEFSALSSEQINKLIDVNILRVVSIIKNDGSKTELIVELPHDRFCGFIMNHKKKRFEEIQARNNSLKEWLLFAVLSSILGVVALYIHNVFIDALAPFLKNIVRYINSLPKNNGINEIIRQAIDFVKYFCQEFGTSELKITVCVLLFALLTPCSIVCFAKEWKRIAVALSSCGILISSWLLNEAKTPFDGDIGSFAFISLMLLSGIFGYIVVKWKNITTSKVSLWPFWGSWFLFFCFLFWEFLRSLIIGVSNPLDSFCFVILLPMLLLAWTLAYFKQEKTSKRFFKGKWDTAILMLIISGLTAILAVNNISIFLDVFEIYAIFILTILGIISLLWNIKPTYKRVIAITINVVALIVIYIANLGYFPFVINYKNVYSVHNWRMVYVKDSNTNLLGACDPIDGDTIMPCVMAFDEENKKWKLKSYKFKENPILNGDTRTNDDVFTWEDGVAEGRLEYRSTLEEYIRKVEKECSDKEDTLLLSNINYYSTQLYKEIRNASLKYIVEAKPYSLDDIKSLRILDSLQNVALKDELKRWNPEIKDIELKNRNWIDKIDDDDIHKLLSVITQNMYLYVLKDRIVHEDFPSVFTLLRYQSILYFSSVPGLSYTLNFTSNLNAEINGKTSTLSFGSSIYSNDIINEKCFAWYYLFISLCTTDYSYNAQLFSDRFSKKDKLEECLKELSGINDKKKDLNYKISKLGENGDVELGLKSIIGLLEENKTINDEFKSTISNIDIILDNRKIEIMYEDAAFNRFSKEVLDTLFYILERKACNIYNGLFEDICKFLILTRNLRGYNVDVEKKRFAEINNAQNIFYNSIMNTESEVLKMLEENQEQINKIKETINKIKENNI